MHSDSIQIEHLPNLDEPLLIVGFEGWGNALDISRGMVNYLIGKLKAQVFGTIDSDRFYRFDENRPLVKIQDGLLEDFSPPGGFFYAAERRLAGRDIVLLKATEPTLRWFQFTDALVSLCYNIGGSSFRRSDIVKLVNSRNFIGACRIFNLWSSAAKKRSKGLLRRRISERNLFCSWPDPIVKIVPENYRETFREL